MSDSLISRRTQFALHALAEAYETIRRTDETTLEEQLSDLGRATLQLHVALQCLNDIRKVVADALDHQKAPNIDEFN